MIIKYILPTALPLYYKSGSSYTSVFTVVIPGVTVSLTAVTPPTYYGRVRSFDNSGNKGSWTSLIGSVATLIDSVEITELTASKIKAGTITSSVIALDGVSSVIKSSGYSAGSTGWAIKGDGTAEFGSASIRGGLKAESVFINADNRWRRNAGDTAPNSEFKVGSANDYLYYDGNTTLTFTGDLSAAGGTFSGNLSAAGGTFSGNLSAAGGTFSGDLSAAGGTFDGALSAASGTFSGRLQAGDIYIPNTTSPKFSVDGNGNMTCVDANINGTLGAVGGTFNGTITIGDVEIGNDVGPGSGHYGISLASGDFNNIFIRRSDGVYFFRCGLGTANSIDFNTQSGLNIVGSITGASTVLIGNNTSAGYLYINQGARMIVNGLKFQNRIYSGWDGAFYPYYDDSYDLGIGESSSGAGDAYMWQDIRYRGTLTDFSDRRMKLDIEESPLGLQFIDALKPVSYRKAVRKKEAILDESGNPFRDDEDKIIYNELEGVRTHYGLIAQDVRAALESIGVDPGTFAPWRLEHLDDPESMQSLGYIGFIAPMIKAIQELSAKVANLESKMV